MRRIPQYMRIYDNPPHKETPSYTRNGSQLYTTIKAQSPRKTKYA